MVTVPRRCMALGAAFFAVSSCTAILGIDKDYNIHCDLPEIRCGTAPGACKDASMDAANCGGCGNVCDPGKTCAAGMCGCPMSLGTYCADQKACKDVTSDPQNCGACDHVCPTNQACSNGVCCPSGLTGCSNACVDLNGDGHNCGRCAHDCESGKCLNGQCEAVVVATGQDFPIGITVDATNLYWVTNGTNGSDGAVIKSLKGAVNQPMLLVGAQSGPWAITVDATNIYWTNKPDATMSKTGNVVQASLPNGKNVVTLAMGQGHPVGLVVHGTSVDWVSELDGNVASTTVGGGMLAKALVTGQASPAAITADSANLYWVTATEVDAAAFDGSGKHALATKQPAPEGIAVDAANAYWTNDDGTVMLVPLTGGGTPCAVATKQNHPRGIVVDDGFVYWTSFGQGMDGAIVRATKDCGQGAVDTLVAGQISPLGIAEDATTLYWTSSVIGGAIMKVAKP